MNVSDFSHIIDEVKKYTDYIYLHVKWEPLLNPNLDIFLDICDNNNLFVNITTNGTLLRKNYSVLSKHKCIRQINVSLHSENYDEEVKCPNPIRRQYGGRIILMSQNLDRILDKFVTKIPIEEQEFIELLDKILDK